MFRSLRSRLLLSYALVIGVMLLVVGLFLLFVLALSQTNRLVPQVQELLRLDREVMATVRQLPRDNSRVTLDEAAVALTAVADELNNRVLLVNTEREVVRFDSGRQLTDRPLPTTFLSDRQANLVQTLVQLDSNSRLVRFRDENQRSWLGVARTLPERGGLRGLTLITALPEQTPFAIFRNTFLLPLAQAGAAALVVAVLLAWWVSRSVARPLGEMAHAAEGMAQGDYDQRLAPSGPEEVQQLATSFNKMAAQVKQTNQAQRDFVANVSHDLKTPLTSIQGWSQAILDGAAVEPQQLNRAAQVIHTESARMSRLVNQLLLLAKLEANQHTAIMERFDWPELLTSVAHALGYTADEKGVTLLVEPVVLPAAWGNPDQLTQMVTNLAQNAIVHTPAGGEVTLRLRPQGQDALYLEVADTGPGIPAAEQGRIFERFYQVDKARSGQDRGTGLGLAIVQHIVESHHGRIELESESGKGTLFRIWLPLDGRQASH